MKINYIEPILSEYKDRAQTVEAVLIHTGIFPDKNKPVKKLSLLQELILKTTFLLKVNFLEETVVLYAFAYSKQQIEQVVLELEEQEYLYSQKSSMFGKCFSLTRQARYYMMYHPDYALNKKEYQDVIINKDAIPKEASLMKYKNIASYLSQKVFQQELKKCLDCFRSVPKEERQRYCRKQYIKYFIYKDFLTWEQDRKETFLQEIGFDREVIQKYAFSNLYSNTFVVEFAKQYLKTFGEESIETLLAYQVLKKKVNQSMKTSLLKNEFLYHFLKDFINQFECNKETILLESFQLFHSGIHNMLRNKDITFREALIACSHQNKSLIKEKVLYLYGEKERILSIHRRVLIRTHAFQKGKEESVLQEATLKLEQLDMELNFTIQEKMKLEEDFSLLLYEYINPEENNTCKEKVITFQQLKSSGIYIGSVAKGEVKPIISFVIVHSSLEPLDLPSLFQRLEKIWCFYYRCLLEYEFQIELLCYGEEREKQVTKTLKKAEQWFGDIREYQLFHSLLSERIMIRNCEFHLGERFETYRQLAVGMAHSTLTT